MSPELLIAVLAAGAVLLITYGVAARPSEDAVQARLSQLVVAPRTVEEMELQQPFFERIVRPTIQRLARAGRRQEGGMIARIDAKLERAGYPGGLRGADWVGVKLMSLIGFVVLFFLLALVPDRVAHPWTVLRHAWAPRSATSLPSSGSAAR